MIAQDDMNPKLYSKIHNENILLSYIKQYLTHIK